MDFRGAVVEDLQLPPCLPIYENTKLMDARDLVADRHFNLPAWTPVLAHAETRVVGVLHRADLERVHDEKTLVKDVKRPCAVGKVRLATPLEELSGLLEQYVVLEVYDDEYKRMLASIERTRARSVGV